MIKIQKTGHDLKMVRIQKEGLLGTNGTKFQKVDILKNIQFYRVERKK
jgi:hypothetical protein